MVQLTLDGCLGLRMRFARILSQNGKGHSPNNFWYEKCFKIVVRGVPERQSNLETRIMKRIVSILSVFAIVAAVFSSQAAAERRNERETREVIRSLNSKIDDFKYNLDYQLKSSSSDPQWASDAATDLQQMKTAIATFDAESDRKTRKPR